MIITTVKELLEHLYRKGKIKGVMSIEVTSSARDAAATMSLNRINFIAVTKRGNFVGVVSSADTNTEFGSSPRPSERLISDIMTIDVVKVKMEDNVNDLPRILTQNKIRHVVVVDNSGHWRGILSSNEVLTAVIANYDEEELRRAQVLGELGHHS